MATPWMTSVRNTKTLTVYNGIGAGHWSNIFAIALNEFNIFAKPVGIKAVKTGDENAANIIMRLGDGVVKYSYDRTDYQKNFSGTGLHGLTKALSRDGVIEKAFCFLPARPQVTEFDKRGNAKDVLAHPDVMKVIAVHELIHASCLDDMSDHGGDGIFYYPMAYNQMGKVYVPEINKNQTPLPPIRPDSSITGKMAALW